MGHIYTELHEIPIPSEAYINKKEARVFLINDDDAVNMSRKLAKELGVGVGISSGANLIGSIFVNRLVFNDFVLNIRRFL